MLDQSSQIISWLNRKHLFAQIFNLINFYIDRALFNIYFFSKDSNISRFFRKLKLSYFSPIRLSLNSLLPV